MNRFIWLLLLLPVGLVAQTVPDRAIPGWCQAGATKAQVSGMSSSNTLQGTIPDCTVTVYLTGTTTRATIHSDSNNTPLSNPFTAADSGQWTFWAQPATAYDIVLSGGRPGNTYPQPVTLTAIQVGGPGAGGATSPGGNNQEVQFNANGFFQGTTGLSWNSGTSTLNYPSGTFSAGTVTGTTITASGAINAASANVSGTITSTGAVSGATVNSTGDTTVGGTLNTSSVVATNGVTAATVNAGTVTSSGPVNGATLNATGNATVGGNLTASGLNATNGVTAATVTATGAVNAGSLTAGAINGPIAPTQVTWPPTCTGGTVYNPSNNSCVAMGTGNNPAGANGQLQYNSGGFFGAVPGTTFDAGGNFKFPASVTASTTVVAAQPLSDIRHSSFAGGAICDGTTNHPIDAALLAAIASLPTKGGEILIPGNPNFCYLANPIALMTNNAYIGTGSVAISGIVTLQIQGSLHVGTTFVRPSTQVNLIGIGGYILGSFQGPGRTASITLDGAGGPNCYGSLGTAINPGSVSVTYGSTTVTGTGTAFTSAVAGTYMIIDGNRVYVQTYNSPTSLTLNVNYTGNTNATAWYGGADTTFTPSSMGCMKSGANISVGGPITCTITSLTRTSNIVTATLSSACHIPPNSGVTVAGVTDSSFNGAYASSSQFYVIQSDWQTNTVAWNQTGANATSSGGTVTGFNEDSAETAALSTCSGSTCTGKFYRQHASSDFWAVVTIGGLQSTPSAPLAINTGADLLQDLNVNGEIWLPQEYRSILRNVLATQNLLGNYAQHTAIEINYSSFITMDNVVTNGSGAWGLRLTQPWSQSGSGSGPVYMNNFAITNGIKMDHGAGGLYLKNGFVETTGRAVLTYDPTNYWSGVPQVINIEGGGLQDNPYNVQSCVIYSTSPAGTVASIPHVSLKHFSTDRCYVNAYTSASSILHVEQPDQNLSYSMASEANPPGVAGTLDDGKNIDAPIRGLQADMHPAAIPHATLATNQDPTTWSCSGCTVTTGQPDPSGGNTAGYVTSTGNSGFLVLNYNVTCAVGDVIIWGGWVFTPTANTVATAGGSGTSYALGASPHCLINGSQQNSPNAGDSLLPNDGWHYVSGIGTVTYTDGLSTTLQINTQSDPSKTMGYWKPWAMYIAASENIPFRELNRWKRQTLGGCIPASATAGTMYSCLPITLPSDPTVPLQAATKNYVDKSVPAPTQFTATNTFVNDNFQRAAGPLGANWTTSSTGTLVLGITAPGIVGASPGTNGKYDFAWYTGTTFVTPQCAQFTIQTPSATSGTNNLGLDVNMIDINNKNQVELPNTPTGVNYSITKMVTGTSTALASGTFAGTMVAGDVFTFCNTGNASNNLVVFRNGTISATFGSFTGLSNGSPGFETPQNGPQRFQAFVSTGFAGNVVSLGGSALSPGCTAQANQTIVAAYPVTPTMACNLTCVGACQANIQPMCSVLTTNTITPYLCTAVSTSPAASLYTYRVIP